MVTGEYLVETSVFTRVRVAEVRRRLEQVRADRLARCVVTDLELGHSARTAEEWDKLQADVGAFREVALTDRTVTRAKEVQRALADRGLRGRKVPDLLIAAAAEDSRLCVLHYDADFEVIASVTGQAHEWVVARGSID